MRLIFAGTPAFADAALAHLLAAGHEVALVLTQPDRPAGRGMRLQSSPVKQRALQHKIPVAQPRSLRPDGKYPADAAAAADAIEAAQAEAMVVVAYGLILPQWVLDAMRRHGQALGCLNIHASLLPRWRGAAPIHRAIEAGDADTGVCIMQMDAGLDTGPVLLRQAVPVGQHTQASLHGVLADLGAKLVVQVLAPGFAWQAQAQPEAGVCYAHKIEKAEAELGWTQSAESLVRRVRAFDPFPGTVCHLGGEPVKVWAAEAVPAGNGPAAAPGTVLAVAEQGIDVQTGAGALRLLVLQRAGGKRLGVADFLHGFELAPGAQAQAPLKPAAPSAAPMDSGAAHV